jgi:hypothetical protein
LADFGADLRNTLRRHPVDFGQRHRTVAETQQIEHLEMFAGLRHRAVVGCHHQQHEIDAGRTRDHGMHQPLVAGHIDKTERLATG